MLLSFCLITNGKRSDEMALAIKSIHQNFSSIDDYEIIVVGNNTDLKSSSNVTFIEDNKFVEFLGKRKNIATEHSKGDVLIHCDDDIIFPPDWFKKFKKYNSENQDWQILGNKILLPDGDRYYDRSLYLPRHRMVPYDYVCDKHDLMYQCGAFSICKKSLLDKIEWSNEIPFYGKLNGFDYNEDVDFSVKLKDAGIGISFDEDNTVWHYDHSYYYKNWFAYKKKPEEMNENKCLDFIMLLNFLDK